MNADDRDGPDLPGDEKPSADEPNAKGDEPAEKESGLGSDVISTDAPVVSARQEVDRFGRGPAPDRKDQEFRRQPLMMDALLLPGMAALACGIIGALGYLYYLR